MARNGDLSRARHVATAEKYKYHKEKLNKMFFHQSLIFDVEMLIDSRMNRSR